MRKLTLTLLAFSLLGIEMAMAQMPPIRLQADFGLANATGDFSGPDLNIGIGYALNARYMFTEQIDAGLEYDASAIVTADIDGGDADATGLTGYLAKGYYRFFDSKVTPFAALGVGLYTVEFPTITFTDSEGNETVIEGESNTNFGFSPELGVALGGFTLGAKFSHAGKTPSDVSATYLRYYLGWTFTFGE